jgi:hypothetical protein
MAFSCDSRIHHELLCVMLAVRGQKGASWGRNLYIFWVIGSI